jgi:hypothetical protein
MDINSLDPALRARLPKGKIEVVYEFLLGFVPNVVVAIERDRKWYLPGGVVEGLGEPTGCTDGQHFQPLVSHVKKQTGLDLVGISKEVIAVSIFEGELGPSVSVVYVGKATGKRTGGELVDINAIPEFASVCPVNADQIRAFLQSSTGGSASRLWRALKSVLHVQSNP